MRLNSIDYKKFKSFLQFNSIYSIDIQYQNPNKKLFIESDGSMIENTKLKAWYQNNMLIINAINIIDNLVKTIADQTEKLINNIQCGEFK